jgi:hypothetical protein
MPLKRYNYNAKLGRRTFCSRRCIALSSTSIKTKASYKNCGKKLIADNKIDEYSPFKMFISNCEMRKKFKKTSFDMDIDVEYLKKLWESQNGICPYTKFKMILPPTTTQYQKTHSLEKASLDRVDSSKGYIRGNVEFVCFFINLAKNSYSKETMLNLISRIRSAS